MGPGKWQVAEVDAANLELEDANTHLEALASAADKDKAGLLQQLEALQQDRDAFKSQVLPVYYSDGPC